jgi:hypothetical protein
MAFFTTSLVEPCYLKASLFFKLVQELFDINMIPLFDENGYRLYSIKDGIIIE